MFLELILLFSCCFKIFFSSLVWNVNAKIELCKSTTLNASSNVSSSINCPLFSFVLAKSASVFKLSCFLQPSIKFLPAVFEAVEIFKSVAWISLFVFTFIIGLTVTLFSSKYDFSAFVASIVRLPSIFAMSSSLVKF